MLFCESRSFFLLNIELDVSDSFEFPESLTRSGEILLVLELGEHLPPILQILAHYL